VVATQRLEEAESYCNSESKRQQLLESVGVLLSSLTSKGVHDSQFSAPMLA